MVEILSGAFSDGLPGVAEEVHPCGVLSSHWRNLMSSVSWVVCEYNIVRSENMSYWAQLHCARNVQIFFESASRHQRHLDRNQHPSPHPPPK